MHDTCRLEGKEGERDEDNKGRGTGENSYIHTKHCDKINVHK